MSAVSARIEDQKFRRLRRGRNVRLLTAHRNAHQFAVAQLLHVRHPLVQFGGHDTPLTKRTLVSVGFA